MIGSQDVQRVLDRIVAFHNPEAIYVFGSYAKGELKPRSDLDLVVVERTAVPRRMRGLDVRGVLGELPFDIDLLFVTPDELDDDVDDPWTLLGTVMPGARQLYRRDAA